jgi:hypothetical protein
VFSRKTPNVGKKLTKIDKNRRKFYNKSHVKSSPKGENTPNNLVTHGATYCICLFSVFSVGDFPMDGC